MDGDSVAAFEYTPYMMKKMNQNVDFCFENFPLAIEVKTSFHLPKTFEKYFENLHLNGNGINSAYGFTPKIPSLYFVQPHPVSCVRQLPRFYECEFYFVIPLLFFFLMKNFDVGERAEFESKSN